MAKALYAGVDSLARKVKKMYLGIEGVARKVKKGYVGVNGIARLFFSGAGKPVYDGTLSMTSPRRWHAAIASTPSYWVIADGTQSDFGRDYVGGVSTFDVDFTEGSADSPQTREQAVGVNFLSYAVFACGLRSGTAEDDVISYDDDLTNQHYYARRTQGQGVAGTTSKEHLVLAGGSYGYGQYVVIFDDVFTQTFPDVLSTPAMNLVGAKLGDKALFYGGIRESSSGYPALQMAYVFDDDMARQDVSGLPQNSYAVAAASMGSEVVLAGGGTANSGGVTKEAYVMDSDLSRMPIGSLNAKRREAGGANLGGSAVIIGGCNNSTSLYNAEYYDSDYAIVGELSFDNYTHFNGLSTDHAGVAFVGEKALVYSGQGSSSLMKFHSE